MDQAENRRSEIARCKPEWPRQGDESVPDSVANSRINRFEHERIDGEWLRAKKSSCTAHRYSDHSHALARSDCLEKLEGRSSIEAFARAERGEFARRLAVCPEVEGENGKSKLVKKLRAREHAETIGSYAVQKKNRSAPLIPFGNPGADGVARCTMNENVVGRE